MDCAWQKIGVSSNRRGEWLEVLATDPLLMPCISAPKEDVRPKWIPTLGILSEHSVSFMELF